MDLFEQVLHAIEGEETEERTAYTADGQKPIQVRTFGPDRWIERAKMGRLDAINFLAVILFAVRDTFNLERERRIVEEWAKIIRAAAMGGEITPRDPVTLLPLKTLPDGWDWLVSLDDADTFVKAQGMGWICTGIVEHLATQSTHPSIALMEQNPQLFTSKDVSAPSSATSSGTPKSDSPQEKQAISGVDRSDSAGMVAWQGDIIENKVEILNKYGNAVSARDLMSWCKAFGSTDVFKRDQPKNRDSIQWTDSSAGDVHTVTYGTIASQLSEWRKQGTFPPRK